MLHHLAEPVAYMVTGYLLATLAGRINARRERNAKRDQQEPHQQ